MTDAEDLSEEESTLAELKEEGVDLTQPRPVQHFLYFPLASLAYGASAELRGQGFDADVEHDLEHDEYVVIATRPMLVTVQGLRELRARLSALAEGRGGVYDGWGVPVPEEDEDAAWDDVDEGF